MMVNAEAIRHARIKGIILEILKDEYPQGIDIVIMRSVLANLNYPLVEKDLAGYLHFLFKENYIEATRDKEGNILWVRLDNKGLKLIDGWITDDSIIFG